MKNIFLVIFIAFTFLSSCAKKDAECNSTDSAVVASATEIQNVQNYLNTNNITGTTQYPSGFFYKVTLAGSGAAVVNLCSKVTVKYVGKLTNGNVFDQNAAGVSFTLGGLIAGWQKGIPLIKSGGKITLYIPPSLGYGPNDKRDPTTNNVIIPGNSILIFDIELVNVY